MFHVILRLFSNKDKVPTINQILRRRKDKMSANDGENPWEYDYISGRSVPGDGRLDFDKSFPPTGIDYKAIRLGDVKHAKQMCHASSGGSLDRIWKETSKQIEQYEIRIREENEEAQNMALANSKISQVRRLRWLKNLKVPQRAGNINVRSSLRLRGVSNIISFSAIRRRMRNRTDSKRYTQNMSPTRKRNSIRKRRFVRRVSALRKRRRGEKVEM